MISKPEKCEVAVLDLDAYRRATSIPEKPTVCLLALEKSFHLSEIQAIVYKAVAQGAMAFLAWGPHAEELCETIERIVEADADIGHLLVFSEGDEPAAEVANFFVNSVYLDGDDYRCLVLYDGCVEQVEQLAQLLGSKV